MTRTTAVLGHPLQRKYVERRLRNLCKIAGVKKITIHGLRHTCASSLLSTGVPAHVVQRRLGHRSVELTLDYYSHVLPAMQADAVARLAGLLFRGTVASA